MNWIVWNEMRSGRGRMLQDLKRGSVWELYLASLTIRIAYFCSLKISEKFPGGMHVQI
jgi:hypothetical protein